MMAWKIMGKMFVQCCLVATIFVFSCRAFFVPQPSATVMSQPGDVTIGGLVAFTGPGDDCNMKPYSYYFMQYGLALAYAVERINKQRVLLPNITVGYQIEDSCRLHAPRAMLNTMKLLQFPLAFAPDTCPGPEETCGSYRWPKPIAIIGPSSSSSSLHISQLLTEFKIPLLSAAATSDELSEGHPYFLRMILPDRYQAEAIVSMLRYYNWTYIATLHREDSYGYNGVVWVRWHGERHGICIAHEAPISIIDDKSNENVKKTLVGIAENAKVRVIVVFADDLLIEKLFSAVRELGLVGRFVFVFSETAMNDQGFRKYGAMETALGSFILHPTPPSNHALRRYLSRVSPTTHPNVKWLPELWERTFNCSWSTHSAEHEQNRTLCQNFTSFMEGNPNAYNELAGLVQAAVDVVVVGLHFYLKINCPEVFRGVPPAQIYACIDNDRFFQKLNATRHVFGNAFGYMFAKRKSQNLFDRYGDVRVGTYTVYQYQKVLSVSSRYVYKPIGSWTTPRQRQFLENGAVVWEYFSDQHPTGTDGVIPESLCSKPCKDGEFMLKGDDPCCWTCKFCHRHEISLLNMTGCEACPMFYWPDQKAYNTCELLPQKYLSWKRKLGVGAGTVNVIGFVSSVAMLALFCKNREHQLIKASNTWLCYFIFFGIMVSYVSSILMNLRPQTHICVMIFIGFNIGLTFQYATLLIKTIHIFRIFEAVEKLKKKVTCADKRSQGLGIFAAYAFQVCHMDSPQLFFHFDTTIAYSYNSTAYKKWLWTAYNSTA